MLNNVQSGQPYLIYQIFIDIQSANFYMKDGGALLLVLDTCNAQLKFLRKAKYKFR